MMVRKVTYRIEARHKIALALSFTVFAITGVFVILSSMSASQPEMVLSMALFITSLLALLAVIVAVSKKSTVIGVTKVTPIKAVKVEPRIAVTAIFRNRLFQAVVVVYLISAVLMVTSKSFQPLPVFLVTLPAFFTAAVGRLSREVIIAREGIVMDNSIIRWDRVHRLEFHESAVILLNNSGFPVAVLPHTPEMAEILRERVGKQNV
ncbi:hypothetical protein [Geoglobus sp.]